MKNAPSGAPGTAAAGKADAVSLLKADHRSVEQILGKFEQSDDDSEKRKLAHQACLELVIHTKLEEEIFYPACKEKDVDDDMLDEAQVEHDGAKVMIGAILKAAPGDEYYYAKVKTLSEYIRHHVAEEEQARTGIFAKAQKAGLDMTELGQKIQARKKELQAQGEALVSSPPQPRSFQLQPQETSSMARYSNDRDRDERGRFTDDNDNGRGGYQGRGGDRDRDDRGRFASDDNRVGSSYGGGRGQSGEGRGWYGDSQGHSQAAREGWEERGSSRSGQGRYQDQGHYQDDDDRRYSHSQGNDRDRDDRGRFTSDDDRGGHGYGSGRNQGGQNRGGYGESQGYSQSSRGGREDSSHEGRGWYGDPQGHSRAAHEGWEDRGHGGRQSGRDHDNDRSSRSGGGQGHGGWFGDPQGHSQASRDGWRNR